MSGYFSTFISGFRETVAKALKSTLPDVRLINLFDGLVVYQTSASLETVASLKFINNSFLLLADVTQATSGDLESTIKDFVAQLDPKLIFSFAKRGQTFRVVFSQANQATSLPKQSRLLLEQTIAKITRLAVEPLKPDHEFWIIYRSEGFWLFGLRLSNQTQTPLSPGQLRPQLAHLLCLVSEPSPTDIVLDPFCGQGAIPLARAAGFPYQQIVASDQDRQLVQQLESKAESIPRFSCHQWGALHLTEIASASIDKIITDPPWGIYQSQTQTDLELFYVEMLIEFCRVITPSGIIVVLTGAKAAFESALTTLTTKLEVIARYNILVSGKKAGVYKLAKICPAE